MDEHELVRLCWFACCDSVMFQVKSRMMGDSTYKNTLECFIKTLKSEVYCFYLFILDFQFDCLAFCHCAVTCLILCG